MENQYTVDASAVAKESTRRLLFMRMGSAITSAMADHDKTFEQIELELGWSRGEACLFMISLMNGKAVEFERISDMAFALGCGIHVIVQPDH